MGWLRDRYHTLAEAAGVRKYVIGVIIATILGAVDWLEEQGRDLFARWFHLASAPEDIDMVFGFPSWIVGFTVLFFLLFLWMLEYATKLRLRLKPKFSVSYSNESGAYRKPVLWGNTKSPTRTKGISVRLRIDCDSGIDVEQCSGYLTKVEFRRGLGEFTEIPIYEPNQLPWALQVGEYLPVSVFPGVRKYLGVCGSREGRDYFEYRPSRRSLAVSNEFKDVGEYRFYVDVVARNCSPVSVELLIKWNGKWDEIQVCLVENT